MWSVQIRKTTECSAHGVIRLVDNDGPSTIDRG
jgi:hypothetical protein